jgi:hypothetical protein
MIRAIGSDVIGPEGILRMEAMEAQEYPLRIGRVLQETLLTGVACLVATVTLREFVLPELPGAAGLLLFNFAMLALIFLRWRSRIRIDEEGIEWRRSKQTVVTRLRWDEVDELFLLGRDGFEVRGGGRSVRLSRGYRIPWNARDLCSDRLAGLRERLRDRALRDGQLVFRMPTARLRAHAVYLAAILFLTGLTGLMLAPLFRPGRLGFPVFIVIFGGSWLWGLRRRASRLGTIVTLYPDGLLVRRLDGRDRIPWSDLASSEWDGRGGLILTLHSGRRIPLPARLGNITLLEEFVEEGRQAAARR